MTTNKPNKLTLRRNEKIKNAINPGKSGHADMKAEHGIGLAEVFFFGHGSYFIANIELLQVSLNVTFRKANVEGFVFAISANGGEEEISIPE